MQLKDIDSQHVIDLAARWQDDKRRAVGVVEALVAEGVPEKLALKKVEQLSSRAYLDYGTSPYHAWPTGKKLP